MSFQVFSQVLVQASSYDLTDIATAKDELGIPTVDTSNDNFLQRAITQTSKAIANYCNRIFQVETVCDSFQMVRDPWHRDFPRNVKSLQLSRWPVVAVKSLVQDGTVLVEGIDFRVDYDSGRIFCLSQYSSDVVGWAGCNIVVTYLGGYSTRATQSASVPGSPGPYSVTVTNSANFCADGGVTYANGVALLAVTSNPTVGQYSVVAGIYTFSAADAAAGVVISYLYADIPDDLVDAVLRMTVMRYKQKDRDPMLVSQEQPNVGSRRWWVGTVPGQNGSFPPEIQGLLDSYCVPVAA